MLDITDVKTIASAKETIEKAEGKLDVLVNNAGQYSRTHPCLLSLTFFFR